MLVRSRAYRIPLASINQYSQASWSRKISQAYTRKQLQALPTTPARTRFAPSPTGYLHLGSLRTALFNFLLAKATNGEFILRVEDTDRSRTVKDAESRLCEDLRWAGLSWDEGPEIGGPYGPYRQSERTQLYRQHAEELISSGHAYRCFCTAERLDQLARQRSQLGLPTDYDRSCAGIHAEESARRADDGEMYTVRLRSPTVYPKYYDLVYGNVGDMRPAKKSVHAGQGFDDPILLKSDGMPTYHLANVVDDHHMRITHVVRAVEWMPSTPKHVAMYSAFGWEPPTFAHVGLLQDTSGQKLSKRNSATVIQSFAEEGIFPEALLNYVALLGWSHPKRSDMLPMKDLIDDFTLKFTKGNTMVNLQKLYYLQKLYSQKYVDERGHQFESIVRRLSNCILEAYPRCCDRLPSGSTLEEYVGSILKADSKHFSLPADFITRNRSFFEDPAAVPPPADVPAAVEIAREARQHLIGIPQVRWTAPHLKSALEQITSEIAGTAAQQQGSPMLQAQAVSDSSVMKGAATQVSRALRWKLMGGSPGPPMISTMEILGRECVLERINEL